MERKSVSQKIALFNNPQATQVKPIVSSQKGTPAKPIVAKEPKAPKKAITTEPKVDVVVGDPNVKKQLLGVFNSNASTVDDSDDWLFDPVKFEAKRQADLKRLKEKSAEEDRIFFQKQQELFQQSQDSLVESLSQFQQECEALFKQSLTGPQIVQV